MRRKVIQDFANVFCQKFIQLPSGYDVASFVRYGSGIYGMNILGEVCFYNENPIPALKTSSELREWLVVQTGKHNFSLKDLWHAHLEVEVGVAKITVEKSDGHYFAGADFSFDCRSKIVTDEKVYASKRFHRQRWYFDWYYEQLYGSLEHFAKR